MSTASNDQSDVALLNSYQNWEDQYNNRNKKIFRCRCQGSDDNSNNDANAHHYLIDNSHYEKIEALDRKKDIVSRQSMDYLRNQEIERIKRLKEYQEQKMPQLALMNQSQIRHSIDHHPVSRSFQANLYNDFEKKMQGLNTLSQSNTISYKNQQQQQSQQSNLGGGIRREATTITDQSSYDKHNNKDYEDYLEKHKEYSDYNLLLSKTRKQSNERQFEIDKLHENNVIIKKNFFNEYDSYQKSFENDRRQQYKQSLDEQRMYQVRSKLAKERYTIESAMRNPQYFHYSSPEYIDQTFLNHNQFVEVNPCKSLSLLIIP